MRRDCSTDTTGSASPWKIQIGIPEIRSAIVAKGSGEEGGAIAEYTLPLVVPMNSWAEA